LLALAPGILHSAVTKTALSFHGRCIRVSVVLIYIVVPVVWHYSRLAMVQVQWLIYGVCSSAAFTRASAFKIVMQLQCSSAYDTLAHYSATAGAGEGKGISPARGFRPTSKPPQCCVLYCLDWTPPPLSPRLRFTMLCCTTPLHLHSR
jgi:hypothetical protein